MASGKTRYFATVPADEIVPSTNKDHESNVKGIYVVGDVTGLPLVKIAANQGVDVIAKMDRAGAFATRAEGKTVDVAIVGAGPAGLAAAIEAGKKGLSHVVLERAHVANTVRSFPPGKKVYSEPRYLKNESDLPAEGDLPKEEFLEQVEALVKERGINLRQGVEVKHIRKRGSAGLELETADGEIIQAVNVIVAVGRQGQPRLLEAPGSEKSTKVTYRFHTADDYHDKDVLVVGGGNSAIEAALMLCDHNRVTISYRREGFFRLKEDNRQQLDKAVAEDRIKVIFESNVKEIRDNEVDLAVNDQVQALPNDNVIILIGSMPPIDFLMNIGLKLDGIWTGKRVALSIVGVLLGYFVYFQAKRFSLLASKAGDGVHHIPGFSWLFKVIPDYFGNLYGFYYLMYFSLIAFFGLYWAIRYKHRLVWRRNLTVILCQWTLWWGAPTFLAVFFGRNAWTPLLGRLLNAWPLNMGAFDVAPVIRIGDPAWWQVVAFVGVLWAVLLTFVVLPIFTVLVGKHYCSHVCSCGALAETVGNAFRHRGPKGDGSRWLERLGFVFIPLATIATVADLFGYAMPLAFYNVWVGTLLAGALAIGLYPFLGQRIWCRYWCPLAFWMNFWGKWSRFKISPEPGKCIDCNVCNKYCQMGIDIRSRALQGVPVTLKDTPCVACGECIVRCPMEILHFGDPPKGKPYKDGTDAGPQKTIHCEVNAPLDIPKFNDKSMGER